MYETTPTIPTAASTSVSTPRESAIPESSAERPRAALKLASTGITFNANPRRRSTAVSASRRPQARRAHDELLDIEPEALL